MAKDEQGIDPKAKDGVPNEQTTEDQLVMTRARKKAEAEAAAAASDAEAEAAMGGGKRGQPIDDQPENEPEPVLFPSGSVQGDHKVTIKNIVPAAKARKTEAKMGSTAIPMRDGLVRYGEIIRLVVDVEAGAVKEVPDLREPDGGGQRLLMSVKDVQTFRPVHVESAAGMFTLEQMLDILERDFGIARSSDKIAEVFGPQTPQQRAAAAAG